MKTVIEMAREAGLLYHIPFPNDSHVAVALHRFANLVRADERERIKQENAPVIASINAHIQTLEEAAIRARSNI